MPYSGDLLTEAKGQFAQAIVGTLLEHAGYRVVRLGIEETVSEVKSVVARREAPLRLPEQLRAVPDLLVIDLDTGDAVMVEVKFRKTYDESVRRELHQTLSRQAKYWPEAVTLIICPDAVTFGGSAYQDYIRGTGPGELNRLIEQPSDREPWFGLRAPGGLFPRILKADGFHADADKLISAIRAWADSSF